MINYLTNIMTEMSFKNEKLSFSHEDEITEITLFVRDNRAFLAISVGENNLSTITEFDTFQGQLFEWALTEFSGFKHEMTKNAYLIILVEDVLSKNYEKKVFINIEEDAFFFKKYVLAYSEKELSLLSGKTSNEHIVEALGNLAIKQTVFEKFSNNEQGTDGYERLLYQLFIKIPVISLPTKAQEIGSLQGEIEKELKSNDVLLKHEILLDALEKISENQIDVGIFKEVIGKL